MDTERADTQASPLRILVVEDEKKLAGALYRLLERAGYEVMKVHDGAEAEDIIRNDHFDLMLLDLNLPTKSGSEVLQDLRKGSMNLPVIILTARDKVNDRIVGLNLGADDYITKPFDSSELLARVAAVLRRTGASRLLLLQAGDLVMDITKRTVKRGGKQINISQKQFALLEFLMRNKNQVLTRKRILEQVWGYKFEIETNIIDVHMSLLRKAIDEGFPRKLIQTVHNQGYLLAE